MPSHQDLDPESACPGTVKPQYRWYRYKWRQKLAWKCDSCGFHWFPRRDGTWFKGMNIATQPARELESRAHTSQEPEQEKRG